MTAMRNVFRRVRLVSVLLLVPGVLVIAGCANKSKKLSVSGKVTCKGEAVGWGNVHLFSADGTLWSSARLKADGTFTATDVPQGEIQVALQPLPIPPGAKQKKGAVADADVLGYPEKFVTIPPKYQDPKTSDLRYTIGSSAKQLDIQLQ